MRIGIIGGGSIGLLLAAYLSKAQLDVTIYTRTIQQASAINDDGVFLKKGTELQGCFHVKATVFSHEELIDSEIVFIAAKQYDLPEILSELISKKGSVHSVIFLQNGMGHVKLLDELCAQFDNIYIGIVEHGALKHSLVEVNHTGDGELKIGCFQKGRYFDQHLWEVLANVGFRTSINDNWQEIMERKLVVNGVINPLTAIFKVKNGSLISNDYYFQLMRQLFDEIKPIFNCSEKDWQNIIKICESTARNRSSMLNDIQNNRKTEIDAISGVILEKAKEQNKFLPYNQFVYKCVKGMELEGKGEAYE